MIKAASFAGAKIEVSGFKLETGALGTRTTDVP